MIVMVIMAALSFTNLFGITAAGATVPIGVLFFFINKAVNKQSYEQSGLDFKSIGRCFKARPSVWVWVLLPLVMNAVCVAISLIALPEFLAHVVSRTGETVSFSNILLMVLQLVIFALGEEIAWRAFFQNELQKALPVIPALLITSLLFSTAHIASGETVVVIYDIFFVFINSILYGVVFYKTKNACISAISHFAANLFSIIILLII